jgi:hypothetical protein
MLLVPKPKNELGRLAAKIELAEAVTSTLVAEIVAESRHRVPLLNKSGAPASQLDKLAEASAWTDLALALIRLELPAWRLRRLVCEDGTWLCSLSKQHNVPLALDDTADATHDDMALAILGALVEARRKIAAREDVTQTVPQIRPAEGIQICCDNFA